jgi:hypothetical protein
VSLLDLELYEVYCTPGCTPGLLIDSETVNTASSKKTKEKKCVCLWIKFPKDGSSVEAHQEHSAQPALIEADSATPGDSEDVTQAVLF